MTFNKARNQILNGDFLKQRENLAASCGFVTPKWVIFSKILMEEGFSVSLYEAKKTPSKYITVMRKGVMKCVKVRFSNHKPIHARELSGDCDFFVGVTNLGTTNTDDAIKFVRREFGFDENGM